MIDPVLTPRELRWDRALERCLGVLGIDRESAAESSKWADWKVGVASWLKSRRLASNTWLAKHLRMGDASGVSRSVTDTLAGRREAALKIFKLLDSRLND